VAKTIIYFVTDLHGSSLCFRKFINASRVYKPTVMVLGADLAGKAIQPIVKGPAGTWEATFVGTRYRIEEGPELEELEKLIADHGYYPYRAEPGELETLEAAGKLDQLFLGLMRKRLTEWLDLADQRLRPLGIPLYLMLGNDDPEGLGDLLDAAPWGTHAEGKVVWVDDQHEMISWGYSNPTPWHTFREQDEEHLAAAYKSMADQLQTPERAIFNLHPPPLGTQLDEAPQLDANFQVQATFGQVNMVAVGSRAVREIEVERKPMLGLHGHIHEASGIRRLGDRKTLILNPGSDYTTGALLGSLVTVDRDKVSAQLVRG
jgi:Icc-related predicted phosphoesterase